MALLIAAVTIFLAPGEPASAAARTQIEWTKDSLATVQKNIAAKKAVLVDVRSPEEWREGHIDGAIFLPVQSLLKHSFDARKIAKTLPPLKDSKREAKKPQTILYTHCVVGMRAKQAAKILGDQGYEVRALRPGYEELVKAGFKQAATPAAAD